MVNALPILIVEDEFLIALELSDAVAELGAIVVGPVATVTEALAVLETQTVAAAILDANLIDRDVTPVALHLATMGVPLVLHTGNGLPPELAAQRPDLPIISKPAPAHAVIERLTSIIARSNDNYC